MPDKIQLRCPHCSLYCDHPDWLAECQHRTGSIARLKNVQDAGASDSVIDELLDRIRDCRLPLITGYLGNVGTSQALLRVAAQFNGVIGQWAFATNAELNTSEISSRTISAGQSHGLMTTTLGEMRGSADGVLVIGDDRLFQAYPNLVRWLELRKLSDRIPQRYICLIGEFSSQQLASVRNALDDERIHVFSVRSDVQQLPASLATFQQASDGQWELTRDMSDCERLMQSNYLTALWSPDYFASTTYDVWLGRMTRWMIERSSLFRTNGIALDSKDSSFQSVATWQTGQSGCLRFVGGEAKDIGSEVSVEQLLSGKECDLNIWVDTALEPRELPESAVAHIDFVISSLPPGNLPKDARWIGVQRQGIDCQVTGFRSDRAIAGGIYDPIEGLPINGVSIDDLGNRMLRAGVSDNDLSEAAR